MSFDILLRRSRVGFFPASATRRARHWTISLALAVVCCFASSGGAHAHTITWSRVGTVTTLTNGQLCTNDGWNVYCDSTTPTIASGLVGIGSTAPVVSLDLSQETDALALPVGTSGMRPAGVNLANGEIRYNSTLSGVETYVNGTWDTVLTAASLGSSLPAAGSTGQVQFNNGGDLGASANLTWNNSSGYLGIGTTAPSAPLTITNSSATGGLLVGTARLHQSGNTSNLFIGDLVDAYGGTWAAYYNTVVGLSAGEYLDAGNGNVAYANSFFGWGSGQQDTVGYANTFIGNNAGVSTTSGYYNTVSGVNALYRNISGYDNTVFGGASLFNVTTGSSNTVLGYNSGSGITIGSSNTIIGANVGGLAAGLSNNIIIADGAGNQRINVNSSGYVGIATTSPSSLLTVAPSSGNADVLVNAASGAVSSVTLKQGTTSNWWQINNGSGLAFELVNTGATYLTLSAGGVSAQNASISGGLGIGNNTTPINLTINTQATSGTANIAFAKSGGSNSGLITYFNNDNSNSLLDYMSMSVASAEQMRILASGNVGIGTASPNTNALLQLYSTTKGFLPPLLTTANETSMGTSLPTGLVVYNTTNNELESFNGTNWEAVGANAADAAGSTGQVQFNNGGDLAASANFFWDNTHGRVGIGTASPIGSLHIYNGAGGSYSATTIADSTLVVENYLSNGLSTYSELSFRPHGTGSQGRAAITAIQDVNGRADTDLTFKIDNNNTGIAEAMRINNASVVGIGTATMSSSNKLEVNGAASIGYVDTAAPSNGLIVSGNVGIGTTSPGSSLQVNGGEAVGYSTSTAAPTNGLTVSGNVGVGTASVPTGVTANINGPVKVAGTGSEPCTAAQVGSMRYNPTGQYMEICTYP